MQLYKESGHTSIVVCRRPAAAAAKEGAARCQERGRDCGREEEGGGGQEESGGREEESGGGEEEGGQGEGGRDPGGAGQGRLRVRLQHSGRHRHSPGQYVVLAYQRLVLYCRQVLSIGINSDRFFLIKYLKWS